MGLDCNFEFAFKTHRKMNGYNFRGWVSSEKSPENFVGKLAGKNVGKLTGKFCWKTHRKKCWKTHRKKCWKI